MTAEPSAADVKRALPYASSPHYATAMSASGGVAPAKSSAASRKSQKASSAASRAEDQENRRQPQMRQQKQSDDADEDEDEDEDEDDNDEEDRKPIKKSAAAVATAAAKKSKGKASEEDKSADDDDTKNAATKKSRRELPPHTVAILKGWMLSPEHVKHPYPTDEDKQALLKKTGINMKQLTNWFTNARKRIWKPMMRREHSRQLQSAMEYEKTRPREPFNSIPGAPQPPFREGEFPPRPAMRHHSIDVGSLGAPRGPPPFDQYGRVESREAPQVLYQQQQQQMQQQMQQQPPPSSAFPPRIVRSASEALPRTDMDDYIDAMRIRKRVHERSPDGVEVDALGPSDKRYRRSSAIMSPRSLKILQDWVNTHSHLEYPFPSDAEKLQLSRDTGLDVQQIEMWFKNNRERIGTANFAIQNGAPGLSPSRRSLPGRSIPSRDNPMFPPPAYGERRSIPSNGNPMFPPRPAAAPMQRSSIPGNGNSQFPPPPSVRRELSEGYYPNGPPPQPSYGSGQYSAHNYNGGDPSRHVRSMSINGGQLMRPQQPRPQHPQPAPPGAPGLPSLANRSVLPSTGPGPTMGLPRDSRSHTLDMGLFADARRRKMNFQDILASTSSSAGALSSGLAPPASHPLSSVGMAESGSGRAHGAGNSESVYPSAIPAYSAAVIPVSAGQKSFERPHIGPPMLGCPRCGMRLGTCGCGSAHAATEQQQQQPRRIV